MIWLGVGSLGGRAFCPPTRRQARGSADRHVQDRALRRVGGQNALPPKGLPRCPCGGGADAMFPARQRHGVLGGAGTPKAVLSRVLGAVRRPLNPRRRLHTGHQRPMHRGGMFGVGGFAGEEQLPVDGSAEVGVLPV